MPVEIDQRQLVLFSPTPYRACQLQPYRLLNFIDHPRELLERLRCLEAPQKIPGRGRIRNPTRSHQPSYRLAPLQCRLILQTRPVRIKRIRKRQHMIRLVVGCVTLKQRQCVIEPLGHPKPAHKLLRQYQSPVMRDRAAGIALEMKQRMAHYPTLSLGPRKLFGIDTRTRIDVTCAFKCDRYFHLGALCFLGLRCCLVTLRIPHFRGLFPLEIYFRISFVR